MSEKPHYILVRFQDKKHSIDLLMAEDPEFLALCEDFDACVNALDYWTHSKEPEADARAGEYRNLIQELEEEVTQALQLLKQRTG